MECRFSRTLVCPILLTAMVGLIACTGEGPVGLTNSTKTPKPSGTKTPAASKSATATPAATASPQGTPTPSRTASPTPTPKPSSTASPTPNPSPTPVPTPPLLAATVNVTSFAGSGIPSFADGAGDAAGFSGPSAVVRAGDGSLYVADTDSNRIRKVTISTGIGTVALYAGNGTKGSANSLDPKEATFSAPAALALGAGGELYVADAESHRIRKIAASGEVSTIAGSGANPGFANGPGASAKFSFPSGLALDGTTLYVSDMENHCIRKIDLASAEFTVSTVTGSTTPGLLNGPTASAKFSRPHGLALDTTKNLYINDSDNNRIRKIDIAAGTVTTFAGPGDSVATETSGFADGALTAARFNFLFRGSLAFGDDGALYVADSGNHRVRRIKGGMVETLAGTGFLTDPVTLDGDYLEGAGDLAKFDHPTGLALAPDGLVYVADQANERIRLIKPKFK